MRCRAAAALLGNGDVGGRAPGQFGDMVAVRGDPLVDVRGLVMVAGVKKDGVVVKPAGQAPLPAFRCTR